VAENPHHVRVPREHNDRSVTKDRCLIAQASEQRIRIGERLGTAREQGRVFVVEGFRRGDQPAR
jgi:hypothetical protein